MPFASPLSIVILRLKVSSLDLRLQWLLARFSLQAFRIITKSLGSGPADCRPARVGPTIEHFCRFPFCGKQGTPRNGGLGLSGRLHDLGLFCSLGNLATLPFSTSTF